MHTQRWCEKKKLKLLNTTKISYDEDMLVVSYISKKNKSRFMLWSYHKYTKLNRLSKKPKGSTDTSSTLPFSLWLEEHVGGLC